MTYLEDRVARLLDEAVPQPRRDLDPALLRASAPHGRASRLARPLLAAAVVAILAIGLALWTDSPLRPSPTAHGGGQPSESSPPATAARNRALAAATIKRIVRAVHVPGGASEVSGNGPNGITLPRPVEHEVSPNLVTTARVWSVPGDAAAVRQYIKTHLPDGMEVSGSGSDSSYASYLTVDPDTRWQNPAAFTTPTIEIIVKQFKGKVGSAVGLVDSGCERSSRGGGLIWGER